MHYYCSSTIPFIVRRHVSDSTPSPRLPTPQLTIHLPPPALCASWITLIILAPILEASSKRGAKKSAVSTRTGTRRGRPAELARPSDGTHRTPHRPVWHKALGIGAERIRCSATEHGRRDFRRHRHRRRSEPAGLGVRNAASTYAHARRGDASAHQKCH